MTWQLDPAHSEIQFSVRHMMISKVRGQFESFSGVIDFDAETPVNTNVEISIDAASINTRNEQRDGHLTSPDFLDVENYPAITFVSRRVEQDDSHNGRLIGDLTIRDVKREVILDVEYAGQAKSPWGSMSAGFTASTKIDRKEFGLEWNQALETGGVLVGDEVKIDIEVELIQVTEEEGKAVAA